MPAISLFTISTVFLQKTTINLPPKKDLYLQGIFSGGGRGGKKSIIIPKND